MSGTSPARGPGRKRRAFGRLVFVLDLAIVLALAAYLGAYAAARAGGWIMHQSNERHWIPEKRSPGHRVVASGPTLSAFFAPLRGLEEKYHEAASLR